MRPRIFPLLLLLLTLAALLPRAHAVETVISGTGTFVDTQPTASDIPDWTTGWPAPNLTGWDYVGTVTRGSGIYLGNNWVLTCAHVAPGPFTLDGTTYAMVPGSAVAITDTNGVADLMLFQLATAPPLPPLIIASAAPIPLSDTQPGDQAAMIGYGGPAGETWGFDTVTSTDIPVTPEGYTYVTTDFVTAYGPTTSGSNSATNNSFLVGGDSGGGDFIFNPATGQWQLAGVNEAVDESDNDSYFVQLSTYSTQISSITSVPEPDPLALITIPALLLMATPRTQKKVTNQ